MLARLARHTSFSAGRALALASRALASRALALALRPHPLVLSLSKDDQQECAG